LRALTLKVTSSCNEEEIMHPEQGQHYEASQEPIAGRSQFSLRTNREFPAAPAGGPALPELSHPAAHEAPDEMWEDAWPREDIDVKSIDPDDVSELPDSLS
jgi:hypothetical protein